MTAPRLPEQRFILSASTVLNGQGYGYATITAASNVRLRIGHTSVSTNISAAKLQTTPAQPVIAIYQDSSPNQTNYIEGSYSGDRDSSDSTYELQGGESITCEWNTPAEGVADHAGLVATFVVRGLQFQTGPAF